jgi:hypothetical protein
MLGFSSLSHGALMLTIIFEQIDGLSGCGIVSYRYTSARITTRTVLSRIDKA